MVTISAATPDDLPAILATQKAAFQSEAAQYGDCAVPPLRQTLGELESELIFKTFLKAVEDSRVVGSIRAQMQSDGCHIEKLSVHPDFQRRGIGQQLLQDMETYFPQATEFHLFTGHLSAGNIRLYQRVGYRVCREEKISDNLTLIHMIKTRHT